MKKLTLTLLAILTLAGSVVPVSSALADAHKDNFRKRCNGIKAC